MRSGAYLRTTAYPNGLVLQTVNILGVTDREYLLGMRAPLSHREWMRDIVEHVDVRSDDNVVVDLDRDAGPDARPSINVAMVSDFDLTAMWQDTEFALNNCAASYPDVTAAVSRVQYPSARTNLCALCQNAGRASKNALRKVVEVHD